MASKQQRKQKRMNVKRKLSKNDSWNKPITPDTLKKAGNPTATDVLAARNAMDHAKPKDTYKILFGGSDASKDKMSDVKKKLTGRVEKIRDRISYKKGNVGWTLNPKRSIFDFQPEDTSDEVTIQLDFKAVNQQGAREEIEIKGGPLKVNANMSDEDIVRVFYATVKEMEEHERDEFFHLDGQRIFNPHNKPFTLAKDENERAFLRRLWKMPDMAKAGAMTLGELIAA